MGELYDLPSMARLPYPTARAADQVDEYHGVLVKDPYRWMENLEDPDLGAWITAQTDLTEEFLSALPCREQFRTRLKEPSRSGGIGVPIARGKRWFQSREVDNDPERSGLLVLDRPMEEGKPCFDVRLIGEGVMVPDTKPSPDGSLLLLSKSIGGSDWKTWIVIDVDTGKQLDDEVTGAKLWGCWLPDSSGFFYVLFPSDEGTDKRRATFKPQLMLHTLGTSQDADELVYEDEENPHYFFTSVTDDGRYLLVTPIYTPRCEVLYSPLRSWDFKVLAASDKQLWPVGSRGDEVFFSTTDSAPYGRVVAVHLGSPQQDAWRTVVAESDRPLLPYSSTVVGDRMVTVNDYLGLSTVGVHSLDESDSYTLDLPEVCRVVRGDISEPFGVAPDGSEFYFQVTSPTSPSTLLRHDLAHRRTDVLFTPEGTSDFEIKAEVVWTQSRDGVKVPMTLVRSATNSLKNPAILIEGYGGGGDSMEPYDYHKWKVAWMESGGVIASAHLRGGLELGAEWQAAAARAGKLKAMEDFIGCAEYLIDNGVTTAAHIGITGRSSGAMLAAAAVVARPELFGACVAEVGMFDPLRYHLFGLGRLMIEEYGTSENPQDFEGMWAYSPLHRIVEGTRYPPMLLTIHTDDDRVSPGSPYKFAATIQSAQASDAPILLRLLAGAGHFGGVGSGGLDERADILAFLAKTLELPTCY